MWQRASISPTVGLVLMSWASAAWAQNRYLEQARQATADLEFEKVAALLELALTERSDAGESIEIYERLATIHVMFKRTADAESAFVHLLQLKPDYSLPADSSPKVVAVFRSAKNRLTAAPPPITKVLRDTPTPMYETWWFWTAVGVVVVGVTAAGSAWAYTHPRFPRTDLGSVSLPP